MLQEGAVDDYDEKPDDPNVIHDMMRLTYKSHDKDIECEISDVIDLEEQDREHHTFFLELSRGRSHQSFPRNQEILR